MPSLSKNFARRAATLLLAAVLGIVLWLALRPSPQEPTYQGRSLRSWLREYHRNRQRWGTDAETTKAALAIRHIGTNGVATLLRMLCAEDPGVITKLQELDRRGLLLKVRPNPAWLQQQEAAMGFELLGPDAKDAVPALVGLFERRIISSGWAAGGALGTIGPGAKAAVPALLAAATNADPSMRPGALLALKGIHSDPARTIPVMVGALNDTNRGVAVVAYCGLVAFQKEARPILTQLLTNQDATLRLNAADAIRKLNALAVQKPDGLAKPGN
jgi:HEAT repeat protein